MVLGSLVPTRTGADLPGLLLAVAVLLLAVVAVRLLATALLMVLARVAPRAHRAAAGRLALRLSPRALRPVVGAALGAAVVLTSSGGASAATRPSPVTTTAVAQLPSPAWGERPVAAAEDLPPAGWVAAPPPRPTVPPGLVTTRPSRTTGEVGPDASAVVVRRGDTLWSLAARQLGPGATDAEVAAAWPRWWRANRATVGEDPDLLRPGTRLVVPSAR